MSASVSLAASLASLPPTEREAILRDLTDEELRALEYDWEFWARPEQLPPPGTWTIWLLLAGRGFGKTRTGAEFTLGEIRAGRSRRAALVAPTSADTRDVLVEGESGILTVSPPWDRPRYEPSKRRLTWKNGAIATLYSADEPDRLRGPQHDLAWADEIAAWRYPDAWDQLMFGLRLGTHPRVVATTTPKPVTVVRELVKPERRDVVITRGRTDDNIANLAPAFLHTIVAKYRGTRLGRQELDAQLLEDVPGALWRRADIDAARVDRVRDLGRTVVAVDPAVTSTESSNETGIVVAARGVGAMSDHCYVLRDLSGRHPATEWPRLAVTAGHTHAVDAIVAETNNGGDLVEAAVRTVDPAAPYRGVHASRGKRTRAEPVALLYEQGKVHHVGSFAELEDQMCTYVPDESESPDRIDALVWAISDLMFGTRLLVA